MKHTKIVCTLGPASETVEQITKFIHAGMNVARLNFSHNNHAYHAQLIKNIRAASKKTQQTIAILQDVQGPRIRVGSVPAQGIQIKNRQTVIFVSQTEYEKQKQNSETPYIPIQFTQLYKYVKEGIHILIQDGTIDAIVERVSKGKIACRVVQGGIVYSHKGMNVPDATITTSVITAKDKEDIAFGVKQGVDYIALSFVRDAKDIEAVRKRIPRTKNIKIIAKIERKEGVYNFDSILEAADGIMVARGDLGVEVGTAAVPLLQKKMVPQCLKAAKPVIVATQMLESMTTNPRPTRAEAADVANAVIDHADALMLSAESANGKFPVKAVKTMSEIIAKVEKSRYDDLSHETILEYIEQNPEKGMASASVFLAESIRAAAVVVWNPSGDMASFLAQLRPQHTAIIVCTNDTTVQRHLSLVWGVTAFLLSSPKSTPDFVRRATALVQKHKHFRKKSKIVFLPESGTVETVVL